MSIESDLVSWLVQDHRPRLYGWIRKTIKASITHWYNVKRERTHLNETKNYNFIALFKGLIQLALICPFALEIFKITSHTVFETFFSKLKPVRSIKLFYKFPLSFFFFFFTSIRRFQKIPNNPDRQTISLGTYRPRHIAKATGNTSCLARDTCLPGWSIYTTAETSRARVCVFAANNGWPLEGLARWISPVHEDTRNE